MLRQRLTSGGLRRGGLLGRSVVQLLDLVLIVFLVLDRLGGVSGGELDARSSPNTENKEEVCKCLSLLLITLTPPSTAVHHQPLPTPLHPRLPRYRTYQHTDQ